MVDIHKLIMLIILIINTKQNRYRQYFEIILHIQLKNEMNYKKQNHNKHMQTFYRLDCYKIIHVL